VLPLSSPHLPVAGLGPDRHLIGFPEFEQFCTADFPVAFKFGFGPLRSPIAATARPPWNMVRTAGLEPTLPEGKQILSLLRLPISPRPHVRPSCQFRPACESAA
jgi:hypothetical protein